MIKKSGYFLVAIIIVISVFGYFRYNPKVDYKNKIPVIAETVVQINLRKIEYAFVKDFIKNPLTYIHNSPLKDKKEDSLNISYPFYKSVYIPVNTFFYTNTSALKHCFVSSFFEIKDRDNLVRILNKKDFKRSDYNTIIIFQNKDLFFVLKQEKLVCFYQKGKIDIKKIIDVVFSNKQFIAEDAIIINKLKKSNSPISIITEKEDLITFDFNNGSLHVNGVLNKDFNLFLPYKSKVFKPESILNTSGKINTKVLSGLIKDRERDKFKKITTMSLDSIFEKWDGDFSFNLTTFNQETDTIVSYEYDDDFNKIENKVIDKKITPLTTLIVRDSLKNMYNYLYNKNVVKNIEDKDVLVLNPLFKTYAILNNGDLCLTSEVKKIDVQDNLNKFQFYFNVDKYKATSADLFYINNKYFNLIKDIEMSISSDNILKGNISLVDESKFFLSQFLFAED